jgi:hypothetical protein
VTAGLEVRRDGPVGWLVFDRPAQGNALDAAMLDGLEAAWRALEDDPEVRVIVNTGNGSAFQTGLDVAQLARDPDALREQSRRTRRAELRMTAWHNRSDQAGDRGGQRGVRGRRAALRGRRRHRDRVGAGRRSSTRTCPSGRCRPTR